jgi:hypothetical protein
LDCLNEMEKTNRIRSRLCIETGWGSIVEKRENLALIQEEDAIS